MSGTNIITRDARADKNVAVHSFTCYSYLYVRASQYNSKLQPKDATFLSLYIFTDAVHVSGGSSAHHQ
jgi:hypothetical protein